MNATELHQWEANITSGNGLVPSSLYLSQCWPWSLSPYDVTRPQWVNVLIFRPCLTEVNTAEFAFTLAKSSKHLNTLRPRQNGRHFADDIFKCVFLNENVWIPIKITLKFVPQGPINNTLALVQIMAWRRPGDKPLSGPMMVRLPTHICVTQPQWVKSPVMLNTRRVT